METHGQHSQSAQVKAAEVLCAVLAAFAVEQIAGGAYVAISEHSTSIAHGGVVVLAALTLVLTAMRLFHGNTVYLGREYARWHHLEVPVGGRIATPFRHNIDVLFQIGQYLALSGTGHFLRSAGSLQAVLTSITIVLGIRGTWAALLWLSVSRSKAGVTE